MSYDISYNPSEGQNEIKPPIDPIKPDDIDIQKVQELINESLEDFKNEIVGKFDSEKFKEFIQDLILKNNFLQFIDISDEQNPNRKSLQLKNHDSISGFLKDGQSAVNIAMVSKWDKVDFGSSSVEMNLNSKDGIVKINDDKIIATMANLDELKGLISDENLSTKITNLIEAMKDELKGEQGERGPAGPKGDKGDTPSKEELSPIISEVLQGMDLGGNNTITGANVLIGENKPSVNINPESIGSLYIDKNNANLWMCKDNTAGLNVWLNLIDKSQIKPQTPKNIYKFNLIEAVGSAYGVCLSGVVLYDYNGERLYLKAINRDVSVATKPTAFLLFTKEICESIGDNAELNEDYEVGENEILAFLTCEERYSNSTYYYPDYIFKPYKASDTLSYYMSSKKSGFVQIEVFGEKNKLGKIEFRNGVSGRITSKLTLSYFTSDINAEIKEISTSEEFNPINQDPMKIIYNDNFPKPDESKILELILTSKETSSNASLFKDLLIETNKGFLMPIGVDILAKDSNTVSNVLFTYSNTKDFKLPSEGSFKSPSDMSELRAELSCDKSSAQESNVLNAYKGGNFLKCDEIGANFKIKLFGLELKDIKNITHLNTGVDGANITKIDFLIKENDNEVFKKLDWTDFKTTLYKKGFLDENSDKNFISLDISSTKPPCCFSALTLYKNNTLLKPKFASVYNENCVEVIFSTDEGLENPKNYLPSIPSNYKLLENECRISLEAKEAYGAGYGAQELIYQSFGYQNGRSYYCAKRDDNTDLITIRALEGIKIDEISHFTFLNGIGSGYPNSYLVTKMIVKKFNENKEMSFNTTLNDLVFQNTQSYQVNLSKTTTTSKTRSKK